MTGNERQENAPAFRVEYAEAIRIALNNIEAAVATVQQMGYRVSAKISYGRILSVGVVPEKEGVGNE